MNAAGRSFVVCVAAMTMLARGKMAAAQACDVVAIGVPVANADTTALAYFCRGVGEVFQAADTLIQSLSIWRAATPALDGLPRYLYITEADSLGEPDITHVLLSGPSLVNQVGDGINPVEYRFVFDPPFALPHRGRFFFDVLADQVSAFNVPAVRNNPYPDGSQWETSPVFNCDQPGPPFDQDHPSVDLAFQIVFCRTSTVPTRSETWGRVKVHYR